MTSTPKGRCNWTGLMLGVSLIALGVGVWYGLRWSTLSAKPAADTLAATVLPSPKPLEPFHLTDSRGRPFSLHALEGHWTLLDFGYTYCPDVCPTTLSMLDAVARDLAQSGSEDQVRIVFISVDPERDTPKRLAEYVTYFNPTFLGATGTDADLHALTDQLGVLFLRVDTRDSALGYVMDHSTHLILIDPQARMHAIFSSPHEPKKIAADIKSLVGTSQARQTTDITTIINSSKEKRQWSIPQ